VGHFSRAAPGQFSRASKPTAERALKQAVREAQVGQRDRLIRLGFDSEAEIVFAIVRENRDDAGNVTYVQEARVRLERAKVARIVGNLADPASTQAVEILDAAREIAGLKAGDRKIYIAQAAQAAQAVEQFDAQQVKLQELAKSGGMGGARCRDTKRTRRGRSPRRSSTRR
jgi:hypothetical protein